MTPREKWIAALRSGDYKQTKGLLSDGFRHCCLGVACEVYQAEVGDLRVDRRSGITRYDGEDSRLPLRVARWLGFQESDPLLPDGRASGLNDEGGYSFEQIADQIEAL